MAIRDLIPLGREKRDVSVRRDDWTRPFYSLQREINRMFDDFFSDFRPARFFDDTFDSYMPRVDVKETDKEIMVSAELPGMDSKDVDISITDDVLSIRGEKKEEKEDKSGSYYRRECSYGSFHRDIPLPAEIMGDQVEAEFKKGVLNIRLPLKPEAQKKVKKIEVKVK